MERRAFKSLSLLGFGCFSFVYSVASSYSFDKNTVYALKRFSLQFPIALRYALNELRILKKLTLEGSSSPFLPTLYYSFTIENSPVLVIDQARDITLLGLLSAWGPLKIKQAVFYVAEMICGLKHLHELRIVHMELKLNNILLSKSGHIMLSDFDRSYDLIERRTRPKDRDFIVNPYYMAPEIARRETISDKADVWSLGVIMADLIGKSIYPMHLRDAEVQRLAMSGSWKIEGFSELPKGLREFFQEVFTIPHILRPNIRRVQEFPFFKKVKWDKFQALQAKPPFPPSLLDDISRYLRKDFDPNHPILIRALYDECLPEVVHGKLQYSIDEKGNQGFVMFKRYIHELGCSQKELMEILEEFNFIHPCLAYRRLLAFE